MRKHEVSVAMRPYNTLRKALVHPKDKVENEKCGVVYKVLCKNCKRVYIGETGRKLGTRLTEHQKDVKDNMSHTLIRSGRRASEARFNKSAITDHATRTNHIIDLEGDSIAVKVDFMPESFRF